MPTTKQIVSSPHSWVGAVTILAGVVNQVTPFIPPQYAGIALAASGLLHAVLAQVNQPSTPTQ